MTFIDLITKQQAIEKGIKHYFTGLPCKRGHIAKRNTANSQCRDCAGIKHQQWVDENKEKVQAYNKQWFEKNHDTSKNRNKDWYSKDENLALKKEKMRVYYEAKKSTIKEKVKTHRQNNPHIERANSAKKRATKLHRTPCWLTRNDALQIKTLYELASKKTIETGIAWHVDHIIPLRGKKVSGLHVPQNLRVIPASENLRKSNNWESA
jgi:hypothetical protein